MVLLLTMLGCVGALEVSGPSGLVGRVLSAEGAPIEGLQVETLETRARTDADGRFAIPWKPPNQIAHFQYQGTFYQRVHQPADEGRVVELRLPSTRDAAVVCPQEACSLELRWALDDGLRAVVRAQCEPGRSHELLAAPASSPDVSCRAGKGTAARELSLDVVDRGGRLAIVPAGSVVRVEISTLDGAALPTDCTVQVGGRLAGAVGDGQWAAEMSAPGPVVASCAGQPAVPRRVDPATLEGPVVLEWSAAGPTLDLEDRAPWLARAQLVSEDDGWSLALTPDDAGVLHLPPLGAGRYRLLLHGAGAGLALAATPPEAGPPGTLVLAAAGDEALVGVLEVEVDRLDGRLPVEGP